MSEINTDVSLASIPHNNVDLIMKVLGNEYNNKSFAAYGLDLPKIINFRPTDLPRITADERFADHIFDLEDGSHAIVDYESKYLRKNFVKYANYISRVLDRDMAEDDGYRLRFITIYTGEVQSAPSELDFGCMVIKVEQVFLSRIDGSAEYEKINKKINSDEGLSDEDLMKLIILPLTEKGTDAKRLMADRVIDAAKRINAEEGRSFVLSGMSVAGAGFMTSEQYIRIMEVLNMTKLGELYEKEKIEYGDFRDAERLVEAIERAAKGYGDTIDAACEKMNYSKLDYDRAKRMVSNMAAPAVQ